MFAEGRLQSQNHVEMGCLAMVWIEETYCTGDGVAPVATLSDWKRVMPVRKLRKGYLYYHAYLLTILVIAKLQHQLVQCLGILSQSEALLIRPR